MIKLYLTIAVVTLIGGVVYGGFYVYQDKQKRIATLQQNNAKLEVVAKENEQVVRTMRVETARLNDLNRSLQGKLSRAEESRERLLTRLQEINLKKESMINPIEIEKRINDGTDKMFDDLESITSAVE
jgi:DNA anti-recombination protein RmuC|tara:strand:+ start:740 stop:1123 length:384 start_codon:yes stop_codon:yes gene_type:complete